MLQTLNRSIHPISHLPLPLCGFDYDTYSIRNISLVMTSNGPKLGKLQNDFRLALQTLYPNIHQCSICLSLYMGLSEALKPFFSVCFTRAISSEHPKQFAAGVTKLCNQGCTLCPICPSLSAAQTTIPGASETYFAVCFPMALNPENSTYLVLRTLYPGFTLCVFPIEIPMTERYRKKQRLNTPQIYLLNLFRSSSTVPRTEWERKTDSSGGWNR